jgi:general secretion pathway protein G
VYRIFTEKRGFTLIELLVVLTIIGLLISVILVSFGPPRKEAKDVKRQTDIKQIGLAMALCYDDSDCGGVNRYPVTGTAVQNIDIDETPCYLCPVSDNPSGGDYAWIDNSADTTKYCVYVKLQATETDTWIAANHQGVKMDLDTEPSILDCW